MVKCENVLEAIGNTPHVKVNRLYPSTHTVYVKVCVHTAAVFEIMSNDRT